MVKEAKMYSQKDQERKKLVEAKNQAENTI